MELEKITTAPKATDFTALSEHEEQTPSSFFGAKPVLHLPATANLRISPTDLESQPALSALLPTSTTTSTTEDDLTIEDISVWVSSHHLTLFSPTTASGARIPYPAIVIHAQEGSAVLLGLNLSDSNTADEDMVFIQLRLIPTSVSVQLEEDSTALNGEATTTPVQKLFKAISECQELNPDPVEEGDEDGEGGFDETAPGATGWITSENMHEFVGEDGELRMPEGVAVIGGEEEDEPLGEGAGRTRRAEEVDGVDGEEAKWQRTG
ncbi:uncharacterized protein LTR77_009695 [Saxophila tyrrhenica]|uniref:Protein LOT5 n=1 Tax=Saxophila tyrrhenica TaxID=1690608 RepID=A0AAV9NWY9_9PEZI|nr:hypothetical protein LTR77_009695 [Saxophila tyrrhenica]